MAIITCWNLRMKIYRRTQRMEFTTRASRMQEWMDNQKTKTQDNTSFISLVEMHTLCLPRIFLHAGKVQCNSNGLHSVLACSVWNGLSRVVGPEMNLGSVAKKPEEFRWAEGRNETNSYDGWCKEASSNCRETEPNGQDSGRGATLGEKTIRVKKIYCEGFTSRWNW